MPPHDGSSAGALIRRARHAQGLSQTDLADRAQLSVRTIRAIERDGTAARRPGSVRRLVAALDLSRAEREDVLDAAGLNPSSGRDLMARMFAAKNANRLMQLVEERFQELRTVCSLRTVTVGADRRITGGSTERVLRAGARSIDGTFLVVRRDSPDAPEMEVRSTVECEVRRRAAFPESLTTVFEIGFPRRVAAGGHHCYGITIGYGPGTGAPVTVAGEGFHQRSAVHSLRVLFAEGAGPVAAERVFRPAFAEPLEVQEKLALSPGSVQYALTDAPAGWHGIRWRWPEGSDARPG